MSDESNVSNRASPQGFASWNAYWVSLGMPWRTESEIDPERQQFLAARRALPPDPQRGIYPFRDVSGPIRLSRGDIEWLLATHESMGMVGPVDIRDARQAQREGLELYGADLREVDLRALPLARLQGGLSTLIRVGEEELGYVVHKVINPSESQELSNLFDMAAINLENAILIGASLQSAVLDCAHVRGAHFEGASLERFSMMHAIGDEAVFDNARLDGAHLDWAHLEGASFAEASLNNASLHGAHLEATVFDMVEAKESKFTGAFMEGIRMIAAQLEDAHLDRTYLQGAMIIGCHLERVRLRDTHLEGSDLTETHLEGAHLVLQLQLGHGRAR